MPLLAMELPKKSEENFLITDVDDTQFSLIPKYSKALLRCKLICGMMNDPILGADAKEDATKSFTVNHDKPFATAEHICLLVKYIDDIKSTQIKQKEHDFCTLLDLANYVEAPEHILYAFSNKAWPLLQEEGNDHNNIKRYKKHLRTIAQHYLASPKHFAKFIEQKKHLR